MNINICENCAYRHQYYYVCPLINENQKVELRGFYGTVKGKKDFHCHFTTAKPDDQNLKIVSFENIISEFKDLSIGKHCPYYMEHQLEEWNNE